MRVPEARAVPYTAAVIVAGFVITLVLGTVLALLGFGRTIG